MVKLYLNSYLEQAVFTLNYREASEVNLVIEMLDYFGVVVFAISGALTVACATFVSMPIIRIAAQAATGW